MSEGLNHLPVGCGREEVSATLKLTLLTAHYSYSPTNHMGYSVGS